MRNIYVYIYICTYIHIYIYIYTERERDREGERERYIEKIYRDIYRYVGIHRYVNKITTSTQ